MLTKNLPIKAVLQFSILPIIFAIAWSTSIVCAFYFLEFKWLAIPFLPISLIGIAVSFYVGFKNNASNDRQNEVRKKWADHLDTGSCGQPNTQLNRINKLQEFN